MARRIGVLGFYNTVIDGVDIGSSDYATCDFDNGANLAWYDVCSYSPFREGILPPGLFFVKWKFEYSGVLPPDNFRTTFYTSRVEFSNPDDASIGHNEMRGTLYLSRTPPVRPEDLCTINVSLIADPAGGGSVRFSPDTGLTTQTFIEPVNDELSEREIDIQAYATPSQGYVFSHWTFSERPGSRGENRSFTSYYTIPTEPGTYDLFLTAHFATDDTTFTVKFDPPSSWHGSHGRLTLTTDNPSSTNIFTEDGTCILRHRTSSASNIRVRMDFTPANGCRFISLKYAGRESLQPTAEYNFADWDDHTITVRAACDRLYHDMTTNNPIHDQFNQLIYCG